jgi:hypothetical protein
MIRTRSRGSTRSWPLSPAIPYQSPLGRHGLGRSVTVGRPGTAIGCQTCPVRSMWKSTMSVATGSTPSSRGGVIGHVAHEAHEGEGVRRPLGVRVPNRGLETVLGQPPEERVLLRLDNPPRPDERLVGREVPLLRNPGRRGASPPREPDPLGEEHVDQRVVDAGEAAPQVPAQLFRGQRGRYRRQAAVGPAVVLVELLDSLEHVNEPPHPENAGPRAFHDLLGRPVGKALGATARGTWCRAPTALCPVGA